MQTQRGIVGSGKMDIEGVIEYEGCWAFSWEDSFFYFFRGRTADGSRQNSSWCEDAESYGKWVVGK